MGGHSGYVAGLVTISTLLAMPGLPARWRCWGCCAIGRLAQPPLKAPRQQVVGVNPPRATAPPQPDGEHHRRREGQAHGLQRLAAQRPGKGHREERLQQLHLAHAHRIAHGQARYQAKKAIHIENRLT